jgi:hypothetical protein
MHCEVYYASAIHFSVEFPPRALHAIASYVGRLYPVALAVRLLFGSFQT